MTARQICLSVTLHDTSHTHAHQKKVDALMFFHFILSPGNVPVGVHLNNDTLRVVVGLLGLLFPPRDAHSNSSG